MWTLLKAFDEGSAEPFIARLMIGILELRDHHIQARMQSQSELEPMRKEFDDLYGPVLEAMFVARKAATSIRDTVAQHEQKVKSGEIVGWQRNALEIHESINSQLQDDLGRFLNAAVRAIKLLQPAAACLGTDIGGFFVNDTNHENRMRQLEAAGRLPLAKYLRRCRAEWSERLVKRRNSLEHEGWVLGSVKYVPSADRTVTMTEPMIDSVGASDWVTGQLSHVVAFVEEIMADAFAHALPDEHALVEIPAMDRDPTKPRRFRPGFPALENVNRWKLRYESAGFK